MLHADDLDDWRHHWREPYPLMLAVPSPAHLRLNARFADIVVDREDSRVLDFSRFHQTVSCGEPSLRPPEAPVPGRE